MNSLLCLRRPPRCLCIHCVVLWSEPVKADLAGDLAPFSRLADESYILPRAVDHSLGAMGGSGAADRPVQGPPDQLLNTPPWIVRKVVIREARLDLPRWDTPICPSLNGQTARWLRKRPSCFSSIGIRSFRFIHIDAPQLC